MTDDLVPRRDRRAFTALLAAGFLSGCAASLPRLSGTDRRPLSFRGKPIWPADITEDRVIRVVVGLRPYRPSGFVVREARVAGKRVIHDYGHGGAGITLSWGTAALACDLGFEGPDRDYAVIGAGAVGLATARSLQSRGGRVVLYARELPPETTSNIAGGHWWPFSVFDRGAVDPAFLNDFNRATRIAYRRFQTMVGSRYGVSWRENFALADELVPFGPFMESLADVAPEMQVLKPGEHPFGRKWVQHYDTMMIQPQIYLRTLLDEFLSAGGRIVVREFQSAAELASIQESVVFNCTGLGSRTLFDDQELIPARGQLVVVLPQEEVKYNLFYRGAYAFPREDGIILGGTFQRGNWDTGIHAEDTGSILEGNRAAFSTLDVRSG